MLLAPTRDSLENVAREGIDGSRCHFVGNIMAEAVLRNLERARARETRVTNGLDCGAYVLATIHRPENTDVPGNLAGIVAALSLSPLPVLFPVHPRTAALLEGAGMRARSSLRPIDPVGYLDMLSLQCDAAAIVTDSGGIQEEACIVGTPCVTVRRNTERQLTIAVGSNRLVAATRDAVSAGLAEALASKRGWEAPENWDSFVSSRVVAALAGGVIPLAGR